MPEEVDLLAFFLTLLSGAIGAAVVTGLISIWSARRETRFKERDRVRDAFAAAFAAYARYKEFPYVVIRRGRQDPETERLRISTLVRETQEQLSYYEAWLGSESATVGEAYRSLIEQVRSTAGVGMKEAWQRPPIRRDADMVVPRSVVDTSSLRSYENAYTAAAAKHLRTMVRFYKV